MKAHVSSIPWQRKTVKTPKNSNLSSPFCEHFPNGWKLQVYFTRVLIEIRQNACHLAHLVKTGPGIPWTQMPHIRHVGVKVLPLQLGARKPALGPRMNVVIQYFLGTSFNSNKMIFLGFMIDNWLILVQSQQGWYQPPHKEQQR